MSTKREAIATALFDTLNTARLSEHPEQAEEYGRLADSFSEFLKMRGYAVRKG